MTATRNNCELAKVSTTMALSGEQDGIRLTSKVPFSSMVKLALIALLVVSQVSKIPCGTFFGNSLGCSGVITEQRISKLSGEEYMESGEAKGIDAVVSNSDKGGIDPMTSDARPTTYEPFNMTNPHSGWCPNATCYNSPVCLPCQHRFLIEMATARSGSTSVLHMLRQLPHVRMAGENNNALFSIHEMLKNTLEYPMWKAGAETSGAWGHGRVGPGDMACPAQHMIEAINPPLAREQSLRGEVSHGLLGNDPNTIFGFKTIRYHKMWEKDDMIDAAAFIKTYFPCSRIVINYRSDLEQQSHSVLWNSNPEKSKETLAGFNNRLHTLAELLGHDMAYVMDGAEWQSREGNGTQAFDRLAYWLGYRDCKFSRIAHDNIKNLNIDSAEIELGPRCRHGFDDVKTQKEHAKESFR